MKREFIEKAAVVVALPLAAFFLIFTISRLDRAIPAMGNVSSFRTVVIDPGHGGPDGGAVGFSGSIEKEINLDVSLKLRDLLRLCGFRVVMVREDDRSVHGETASTVAEQKRSDLHNRLAVYNADPSAVVISVHQNRFDDASCRGAQIFYSKNRLESKELARSVQSAFVRLLQPENDRQIKPAEENLFLLFHAETPAVLCECGFVSNPEEEALLKDAEYRGRVAFAILAGLLDFLSD